MEREILRHANGRMRATITHPKESTERKFNGTLILGAGFGGSPSSMIPIKIRRKFLKEGVPVVDIHFDESENALPFERKREFLKRVSEIVKGRKFWAMHSVTGMAANAALKDLGAGPDHALLRIYSATSLPWLHRSVENLIRIGGPTANPDYTRGMIPSSGYMDEDLSRMGTTMVDVWHKNDSTVNPGEGGETGEEIKEGETFYPPITPGRKHKLLLNWSRIAPPGDLAPSVDYTHLAGNPRQSRGLANIAWHVFKSLKWS